jgi:hypothetical protein
VGIAAPGTWQLLLWAAQRFGLFSFVGIPQMGDFDLTNGNFAYLGTLYEVMSLPTYLFDLNDLVKLIV